MPIAATTDAAMLPLRGLQWCTLWYRIDQMDNYRDDYHDIAGKMSYLLV